MPTLQFPPPNPGAYNVPLDLFTKGIPDGIDTMTNDPLKLATDAYDPVSAGNDGATVGDYHPLFEHLLNNYWPEVFDFNTLDTYSDVSTHITSINSSAKEAVRDLFDEMLANFHGGSLESGGRIESSDSFLKKNYGIDAAEFFSSSTDGFPVYSTDRKLEIWEEFVRTTEVGLRRWNILIWTWSFLLELMQKLQQTTLNKTLAQRWMNDAQIEAVESMNDIDLAKQKSASDFDNIHKNQLFNHELDIIRGERGNVQRLSQTKSSESSTSLEKQQETNTFITSMIDQLESLLSSLIR